MEEVTSSSISRSSNFLKVLFLSFVGALFVILLLLSSYFIFQKTSEESRVNENISPFHQYQRLLLNPSKSETSRGIITIKEELGPDDFLSSKNEDGSLVLISHFGSKEFKCSGFCYCENDRRTSIASKSIMYLIAAASSLVALEVAKDRFQQECVSELSSECPSHAITSSAETCHDTKSSEDTEQSENEEISLLEKFKPGEEDCNVKYFCKGSCQSEGAYKPDRKQKGDDVMNDYCSKTNLEKEIVFKSFVNMDGKFELQKARKFFAHGHLVPFCRVQHERCTAKVIGCRNIGVSTGPRGKGLDEEFDAQDGSGYHKYACDWFDNCESKNCGGDIGRGCGIEDILEKAEKEGKS